MNIEVKDLRYAYDRLIRKRKDIREEVKAEYREKMQAEIDRRIGEEDRAFAEQLVLAKDAGMTRAEVAEAMRSNDHRRIKYFLNLVGDPGFARGRPKRTALEELREKMGYDILDVATGLVRIYRLGGYTFDEPAEGILRWHGGMNYQLVGENLDEYEAMRKIYRRDDGENRKVVGDLMKIREELEAQGWTGDTEADADAEDLAGYFETE